MKKVIVLIIFSTFVINIFAQRLVKDNPLHAQTRRNVAISWGDWQPKAKKPWWSGGVNVNPNHEMVWGWMAPAFGGNKSRNKNYQKKDIRPLSATGKETQRNLMFSLQDDYMKQSLEEVNQINKNYAEQQALNTYLLSDVDPFYQIFFKKELSFVENFNVGKTVDLVNNREVYTFLSSAGFVEEFNKSMIILKDRFSIAKKSTIERGQRIIFYHNILADYKSELDRFKNHIRTTTTYLSYKDKHGGNIKINHNDLSAFKNWTDKDIQIAIEVIEYSKVRSQY